MTASSIAGILARRLRGDISASCRRSCVVRVGGSGCGRIRPRSVGQLAWLTGLGSPVVFPHTGEPPLEPRDVGARGQRKKAQCTGCWLGEPRSSLWIRGPCRPEPRTRPHVIALIPCADEEQCYVGLYALSEQEARSSGHGVSHPSRRIATQSPGSDPPQSPAH